VLIILHSSDERERDKCGRLKKRTLSHYLANALVRTVYMKQCTIKMNGWVGETRGESAESQRIFGNSIEYWVLSLKALMCTTTAAGKSVKTHQ
jgi:hypothetical protein